MNKKRKIIPRADIKANWEAVNPVLDENELGVETDSGFVKYGDGSTEWNDLDYFTPGLPVSVPSYTVLLAPTASDYTGAWIYVTNDVGGAVMAFSDGTNWLRCTDREIITT